MKFCVNCQWFRLPGPGSNNVEAGVCTNPAALESTNLVSGRKTYLAAATMRGGKCGREANLFKGNDEK